MGKIIKAGVEHYFSGGIGSGSDIVILTQEEYDELVTNNTVESGVYYFIEDVNIEGGNNAVNDASDIIYDNSTSGLEADNIQGAIDEVNGDITELNQNMGGLRFYEDSTGKYVVGADSVPKKLGSPEVKLFACKRVSPGYKETITIPEAGDFTLVVTNGENWGGNSLAVTSATVDYTIEDEYHTTNSADAYSSLRLKLKAKAKDTITIQYGVTSGDYLFATYVMF